MRAGLSVVLALLGWVLLPGPGPGLAQSPFSAAVTVNDLTISHHDVGQRVALLQALGAPEDGLRELAVNQLTDDALKIGWGQRLGVELPEGALEAGVAEFATARNVTPEELFARLGEFGVGEAAVTELIRAGLIWRTIVQGRFRAEAMPSEREIDEAFNLAAAQGRRSLRLAEIVIPFAERGREDTLALAAGLAADLQQGGDFGAAVQDYSRARSAEENGLLGWFPEDRLPALIAAAVLALEPGGVTPPIPFDQGVVIIRLVAESRESPESRPDVSVSYGTITLEGEAGAIRARADALRSCGDFRRLAAAAGLADPVGAPVLLGGLPGGDALRIARLDAGEADVLEVPGGASVLFLCTRSTATEAEAREAMRNLLFTRKMTALGDGLLQEIRRAAVIRVK
jgi:peptidyl-prolyl cis-trans isomerase SurA